MLGNLHDVDYHLTLSGVIQFVQDTVSRYLTSLHLGSFDVAEDGLGWVIFDYDIALDRELPYWPNDVSIDLWVSEWSAVRTYFDFRLFCDGREFAKGSTCWTLIDAKERRAFLHGEEYINGRIKVVPELVFEKHRKVRIPAYSEPCGSHVHACCSTDVDFNSHISNRAYLSAALSCESVDFLRSHTPQSLKIAYLHETHMGDELHCSCYKGADDEAAHIYILKNTADVEVCRIMVSWEPQEVQPSRVKEFLKR